MSYRIGTLWLPMNVLLLCVNVIAQPGFLSIDCGGKRNRTAPNKIRWVTDANYIDVGEIADVGNVSQQAYGSYLHDNLRFFPKPLTKSCYHLPVASNERYLLRTWFAIGNSSGFKQSAPNFTFSIETLDMLAFSNVTAPYDHPRYSERIFVSSGRVVYVCLIRTSQSDDPFINAIELRTLQHGMYRQANLRTSLLMDSRVDLGGKSTVRYPSAGLSALNWKTRLKIALDAAHGMEYLHIGCTPKIIHRDIKTSNILLDTYMNGKLADFGLSKMTVDDGEASHVTTMVKGTPGYLDPEYFRTQMLTEKSDIYSFGVVLLEILCGRPPINTNLPEEQLNLVQWVTPYVYVETDGNPGKSISGEIEEIRDKRMGGNYDIKSIVDFAKLGLRCVDAKPSSRPSASEVVAEIKEIIVHENYNTAAPVSEETGIEHGDWQVGPVTLHAECSKPKDMVWRDNSCNISQVGR